MITAVLVVCQHHQQITEYESTAYKQKQASKRIYGSFITRQLSIKFKIKFSTLNVKANQAIQNKNKY